MTLPAGTVISYVGSELNSLSGWLLCDGSAQSPSAYPALAQALGGAFGTDASGNFYLPDLRGVFLRGVDGGAAVDPDAQYRTAQINAGVVGNGHTGDAVGSCQADEIVSHSHALGPDNNGYHGEGDYSVYNIGFQTPNAVGPTGGSETRPKNVYVYYLICTG